MELRTASPASSRRVATLALALPLFAAACGSSDDDAPGGGGGGPFYVIATAISDADDANTYVKVMDHIEEGELDIATAREFPGWSDLKVHNGAVFVSSGEAPRVYRFQVDDSGKLVDDGEIDFGAYTSYADMYSQVFISEDKAYLLGEAGEYVIWNPKTMEITGAVSLPNLAPRMAIDAAPALDRGMFVRDGRLYHTVAFSDYENYKMEPGSLIVVTDVVEDKVLEVIEASCPDLNVIDQDAAGNLYFSNWVYSPGATLVNGGAPACAMKMAAGETTIDTSWTTTFADVTGGHEAAALNMLDGGRAILSVFMEDHQAFDPAQDDVFDWIFGANWKSYTFDLDTKAVAPVTGLDWHSGGYYASRFDDRTYILLPGDGYTTTTIYELGDDGSAALKLHSNGWATRLFRVR